MEKKKEDISLLDKCVREALRLGYGTHYGAFIADFEKMYGSMEVYFDGPPAAAPPFGRKPLEKTVNAPKVNWTADLRYCKRCGAPVPIGADHLWFCSESCYQASRDASRKRWKNIHRPSNSPRSCQFCGRQMEDGVRKNQKYCSVLCRKKARNQRQLVSVITAPPPVCQYSGTKKY